MSITWEKAIRHIDRAVKPTRIWRMRSMLLKAEVKRKRKKPTRILPSSLVLAKHRLRLQLRLGQDVDPLAIARLAMQERRYRLNERKREQRATACRRFRSARAKAKINLWRTRQQWLRDISDMSKPSGG